MREGRVALTFLAGREPLEAEEDVAHVVFRIGNASLPCAHRHAHSVGYNVSQPKV